MLVLAGREALGEQLEVLTSQATAAKPAKPHQSEHTVHTLSFTCVEPEDHQIATFDTKHEPGWDGLKKNASNDRNI